ncbi:NAD(P)-binding protein [Mycena venus]|uniref:NAD(P)-binding protein n=1 Tax=Mycena venus TaxID=2733690 RepID=A0A8H7D5Y9_9AGAR|nr:NAD(P)-binding protein [Mycena venus]
MTFYVITGAARGIGLEFVSQLSADSSNIIFALVRNKSSATALNNLPGSNINVVEADITDVESLTSAANAVAGATAGKLDYLINNAGIHDHSKATLDAFPTKDALDQDLLENFRVNTLGTIHATNAFLPLLRAGTAKKVITISTGAADLDFANMTGSATQAGYAISKAALNMAIAKFAAALKREGFVFLSISPGLVDTAAAERTPQESEQYKAFTQALTKMAPNFSGPLTSQTSVKMMLEVIYRWTIEDTGAFVSHHGNKEWL